MKIEQIDERNEMYVKGYRFTLIYDDGSQLYYKTEISANEDLESEIKKQAELISFQDKCKHETSSLEPMLKGIEYENEEQVKIRVKDVCNFCDKLLGEETQVFKFSHIEEVEK